MRAGAQRSDALANTVSRGTAGYVALIIHIRQVESGCIRVTEYIHMLH